MKSILIALFWNVCRLVSAFSPESALNLRTSSTRIFMSATNEKKRVVVTGLGVISGCGVNHNEFFQNVVDGKSSLRKVCGSYKDILFYGLTLNSSYPGNYNACVAEC
jgi:hypothetical protein